MIKYFNKKNLLFLFLVINLKTVLASSPSSPSSLVSSDESVEAAPVTKRYYEVYNQLICAVVQGNVGEVAYLLRENKRTGFFNIHQKIAYGWTLRHLAGTEEMDCLLLDHGIAPDTTRRTLLVSAEIYTACDGDEEVVAGYIERHNRNPLGFQKFCSICMKQEAKVAAKSYGRATFFKELATGISFEDIHDQRSLDFRGFSPGHYPLKKRAEMAQSIRDGHFVMPVSEPLA